MNRFFDDINERLAFIEFRQELLFTNSDLDRLLFEYEITSGEYTAIMDLMDNIRDKVEKGENASSTEFEQRIYDICPLHTGDYHMCEYIARAFMDAGRWEEVFPALYGDMPKYRHLKGKK